MAGFMDSLNKGIATLNVKTSNFMDGTKYKTEISTKEKEIVKLKTDIGNIVYENRSEFSIGMVEEQLESIKEKYEAIEVLKAKIADLPEKERNILGSSQNNQEEQVSQKIFCSKCGAENIAGYKFCEKCGSPLEKK